MARPRRPRTGHMPSSVQDAMSGRHHQTIPLNRHWRGSVAETLKCSKRRVGLEWLPSESWPPSAERGIWSYPSCPQEERTYSPRSTRERRAQYRHQCCRHHRISCGWRHHRPTGGKLRQAKWLMTWRRNLRPLGCYPGRISPPPALS